VITVQKAYDELVRDHLLIPRRGKGYYVANLAKAGKNELARSRCAESLRKPVAEALQEGLTPREVRKIFEQTIVDVSRACNF
jgi:DNA-binding transcriptional regulator YhcF (GntR family)